MWGTIRVLEGWDVGYYTCSRGLGYGVLCTLWTVTVSVFGGAGLGGGRP